MCVMNQRLVAISAFPNRSLTAIVLMRLVAMCVRNLCSAKTVQLMLFDGQSARLRCPKFQVCGDIFSNESRAREGTDAVGGCSGVCRVKFERRIEQIGPEYALGSSEQLF